MRCPLGEEDEGKKVSSFLELAGGCWFCFPTSMDVE